MAEEKASGESSGVSRKKSQDSSARLQPKLFAIFVKDQLVTTVWALSAREARGKAERVLGGGQGRSFEASITGIVYPIEVISVADRLREALHWEGNSNQGEMGRLFISEAVKAVLMQLLGMKPGGFDEFSTWLMSSLSSEEIAKHFPFSEVFVMWEGQVVAKAASLAEFERLYTLPPPRL